MLLPQLWVKSGICEALKHILSVIEAVTTHFDYAHLLKYYYQRGKKLEKTIISEKFCLKNLVKSFKKVSY